MRTIESVIKDFENHNYFLFQTINLEHQKNHCDLAIEFNDSQLTQHQVDVLNFIEQKTAKIQSLIEKELSNLYSKSEMNRRDELDNLPLNFEIIEIKEDGYKYDFSVICSKRYRGFFLFPKEINLRVEFKNGSIYTIERKRDPLKENNTPH